MTATANVQPEKILKDLSKLWVDLGKEDTEKGSAGVLRACAMTLIAAVEEESQALEAGETIANLVHQHPSRVIVMRVLSEGGSALDARVFAQCWMPFGRSQQICCEQIEITASSSRVSDLPKLVLGIMAPDLPVVIWCTGERLLRDPSFQQLFPLADKIVVDSAAFADAPAALGFIRHFMAAGRNLADLNWTRLTPLREMVAQMFANAGALAKLKDLTSVTVSYAGPAQATAENMPSSLHYLSAWLRSTLTAPVQLDFAESGVGFEIRGIRFAGPDFDAAIALEGVAAQIRMGSMAHRMAFPKRSDCDLLREELSVSGVDSIYRKCLG